MAPASFALIVNDNNVFILKHIDWEAVYIDAKDTVTAVTFIQFRF